MKGADEPSALLIKENFESGISMVTHLQHLPVFNAAKSVNTVAHLCIYFTHMQVSVIALAFRGEVCDRNAENEWGIKFLEDKNHDLELYPTIMSAQHFLLYYLVQVYS